jgi:hypothetical protein
MTALFYEKHVLISRPHDDSKLGSWLAYASVTSNGDGKLLYKQFADFDRVFRTEEDALSFGFLMAREWVDDNLTL